jgi:hypothetical protein
MRNSEYNQGFGLTDEIFEGVRQHESFSIHTETMRQVQDREA